MKKILTKKDLTVKNCETLPAGYGSYSVFMQKWHGGMRYICYLGVYHGEVTDCKRAALTEWKYASSYEFDELKCMCIYGDRRGETTTNDNPLS